MIVQIDKMYADTVKRLIKEHKFTKGTVLSFNNHEILFSSLKDTLCCPENFLNSQKNIYDIKNIIELDSLIKYCHYYGYNLKKLNDYNESMEHVIIESVNPDRKHAIININNSTFIGGLPNTNSFYFSSNKANYINNISYLVNNYHPKILNIASGPDENKKLYAVNVDLSELGKPEFVCDAADLSLFKKKEFIIVRASHILEHFSSERIVDILKEWKRVLHKFGALYIAVPNAQIVIDECLARVNTKNGIVYNLFETTPTLSQIYGIGYENDKTDPRWRHRVLFSYELLQYFLDKVGLNVVNIIDQHKDFSYMCGVKDDASNRYSLIVEAKIKRPKANRKTKSAIKFDISQYNLPLSIITPIRNEANNLPYYLKNLITIMDYLLCNNIKVEWLFVVNGSNDNTSDILNTFIIEHKHLLIKVVYSEIGILNAFYVGVNSRSLNGYIAKIDSDSLVEPFSILAMYNKLFSNINTLATYIEPMPLGKNKNIYNYLSFYPHARSKRVYIHGRCSMYKHNPFLFFDFAKIKQANLLVEDIILSYAYIFYFGFDAVLRTDIGFVKSNPISCKDDFIKKIIRTKKEIEKIENYFPYFKILTNLLNREFANPSLKFKQLISNIEIDEDINLNIAAHQEWLRLDSTKLDLEHENI